ncbi:MAG: cytochrome C biogenesis protein [Betaproteobacteria bacterium]|nr:cytochrome C biogenesis protein [Betaproteobacteria bacterium]
MLARSATALPIVMHGWLLSGALFAEGALHLGLGPALSLILFLAALIYWLASFRTRLVGLQVILCAIAAAVLLVTLLLPHGKALVHANMPLFRAHLLLSIVSYSLFTIASLQALLMATLERRLHGTSLPAFLGQLPPLLSLEALLFRILWAGFVLLTLSLVTGMVFAEELTGKPLAFTHKILFGFISWIIFGALLVGRSRYGWRGRVALRWTLSGFLALVLAYLGTKFVLEVILQR